MAQAHRAQTVQAGTAAHGGQVLQLRGQVPRQEELHLPSKMHQLWKRMSPPAGLPLPSARCRCFQETVSFPDYDGQAPTHSSPPRVNAVWSVAWFRRNSICTLDVHGSLNVGAAVLCTIAAASSPRAASARAWCDRDGHGRARW